MEYLLILLGGLLGSAHCVGMCGGFALTLSSGGRSLAANGSRQIIYSFGRIFTYTVAGSMAGFGGWRLGLEVRTLVNLQAVLSVLAGILLVVEGLFSLGYLRRPFISGCPGAATFASLLHATDWRAVFVAGILNGFLPCGLVYAYLALASSSADMVQGALIMALFGLGTIPALLLTGISGAMLHQSLRRRVFHLAAWCMLATGILALGRGVGFWNHAGNEPVCPFCAGEPAEDT